MRRRRRGTLTRISAWIRGHRSEILRVVRWAAMLVLAILAWREPRGWWSARTKIEYLGTAVLLLINTIMVLRAWRTRNAAKPQPTPAPTQPAPAPTQGMVNGRIRLCIPYLPIPMPSWWYSVWVDHIGLSYTLYYKRWMRGKAVPSDLAYCANPDVTKSWTQDVFGTSRIVVECKDEPEPIVFWVRYEDGLYVVPVLRGLITSACKDNGISRWIPDRRKSAKG